jgi:dTDP-4-amino-4,6-dideoxygalactose transaminase
MGTLEMATTRGKLAVHTWDHANPLHVVLLSHGYGEHARRYEHVAAALVAEGAGAVPGYIPRPVYRYPLFQNHNFFGGQWPLRDAGLTTMDYRQVSCPVTEAVLADSISLPINPALTDEIVDQTAAAVAKVARHFAI